MLSLCYSLIFSLCWSSTVLYSYSPDLIEHLYEHHLLFIRWITYLHFIKESVWGFILFFFRKYSSLFWFSSFTSHSLEEVISCKRWNYLFITALTIGFLWNLCDCPSKLFYFQWLPNVEVVIRPNSVPERKFLASRFWLIWSQILKQKFLKYANIYSPVRSST